MTKTDRTRPMLGALLAAFVGSSVLAAGCGGGSGSGRPPTATEEVYQSREKSILDRYEKTKQQGPGSKRN